VREALAVGGSAAADPVPTASFPTSTALQEQNA
jgi:hypothetical protein